MTNTKRCCLAGVIITLLCAVSVAQTNGAILNTSGAVTLNNVNVQKTAPVYEGDTVHTSDGQGAIATPGSSLSVPSHSEVVYRGDNVSLKNGAVVVSTQKGMTTQALSVNVQPQNLNTTRYEAIIHCQEVTVHAYIGNLTLRVGDKTYDLPEGSTKRFFEPAGHDSIPCEAAAITGFGAVAGADIYILTSQGGSVSPSHP